MRHALVQAKISGRVERVGSLLTLFFSGEPVRNYEDAKRSDSLRAGSPRSFHQMLDRGVFIAPSQFEALLFRRPTKTKT